MNKKTNTTLWLLTAGFAAMALMFFFDGFGAPPHRPQIPLVATNFLDTATWRRSYADLVAAKEDLSDFDCYACHDHKTPPPLHFDEHQNVIVAKEHPDIVMGHGSHGRNNNCFNCHNDANLEVLQTRDGKELKFTESTQLCGSCHGPTYRDWDAGVHGKTLGYWDRSLGPIVRKDCVNCHNPHSPHFPGRAPAPGPHPMREIAAPAVEHHPET